MPKPLIYTKSKVIKLTEIQYQTLKKLEFYNVRVCDFIRDSIAEKLKREKIEIIKPKEKIIVRSNEIYTRTTLSSNNTAERIA